MLFDLLRGSDTLLLTRGRNEEEARGRAEIGTNVLIARIEEMGLNVAVEKTESVIFKTGRDGSSLELNIGGKKVQIKTHMKYLRVVVDDKWDMRQHFKYATEKGLKTIN